RTRGPGNGIGRPSERARGRLGHLGFVHASCPRSGGKARDATIAVVRGRRTFWWCVRALFVSGGGRLSAHGSTRGTEADGRAAERARDRPRSGTTARRRGRRATGPDSLWTVRARRPRPKAPRP